MDKENERKNLEEMKSTIVKRIAAVFLAVAVWVTTVQMPTVQAEVAVPTFGGRTEDWDYNRVKRIKADKVWGNQRIN